MWCSKNVGPAESEDEEKRWESETANVINLADFQNFDTTANQRAAGTVVHGIVTFIYITN